MAEAIHCPSCSTRYRLQPQRLKPSIRRAKCFSCGGVFPVGDVVQRLLALRAQGAIGAFTTEDLEELLGAPLDPAVPPPSLTPGDLEGMEAEILEKTLVDLPAPMPETKAAPEPAAAPEPLPASEPEPAFPAAITETTLSGYTSARDAIDKLFANAPAASAGSKSNQEPTAMDMEATLSALESTLGGTSEATVADAAGAPDDSPTAPGQIGDGLTGPSSSTMRMSQADLQAALAAPTKSASWDPTVPLKASDLMANPDDRAKAVAPSAPRAFAPSMDAPDAGAELLRLKIGEEIYGSLTMPQLIAWVEEGRILESHLVARQHSENWLEAHKVPGLRPVFDRLRRERSAGAPSLDSGISELASKKGLFGGLFGKN